MTQLPPITLYQSYLIRFWREQPTMPWRITLRHVHTSEEWHFVTLESLFVFLMSQTKENSL